MRAKSVLVVVAAIRLSVLFTNQSYAGNVWIPELLSETDDVEVVIEDSVTDGRLPQPDSAKNAFELEFLRSGMKLQQIKSDYVIYIPT